MSKEMLKWQVIPKISQLNSNIIISGLKDGPIVLFIVKPTRTLSKDTQAHKETERRYDQIIRNLGDARIRHASLVLVDTNITTLYDCENNNDSVLTALQLTKSEYDNVEENYRLTNYEAIIKN